MTARFDYIPSRWSLFRIGYWLASGVFTAVGVGAAGVIVFTAITDPGPDSSNPPEGHSDLRIYTDHLTGCQYLRGPAGSLTPRMGTDGKQLCEGAR